MSELERHEDRKAKADKLDGEITWAWETWVDSFEDLDEYIDGEFYLEHGYNSGVDYVQRRLMPITDKAKLTANYRQPIVEILANAGYSNRAIAGALGVSEGQIRKDKKAIDGTHVDTTDEVRTEYAPNEVDAAGQSVEEVGHIDEPERQSLTVPEGEQLVIGNEVIVDNSNNKPDPFKDRFAGIDFDAMIINPAPQQIIQAEPSGDTPDYFVPRQPAPSWSPPHISELPRKLPAEYDVQPDNTPEFLEPPMKLQKAGEANKTPDEKHCKTCNCNLLP